MVLILLLSSLVFLPANLCSPVKAGKFVKEQLQCSLTDRISQGCSEEVTTATAGLLHCVSLCARKENCIGANLDGHGTCFHHLDCDIEPCQGEDPPKYYMANYCTGGTWNSSSHSCLCVNGMRGPRCDVYPRTCVDVYQAGYTEGSVIAVLNPSGDGETLYPILCDMISTLDIKTHFAKNYGKTRFNMTWEQFVGGIFVDSNTFWAGLRFLQDLCQNGCERFQYNVHFKEPLLVVMRAYRNFTIQTESNDFRFSYDSTYANVWANELPPGNVVGDCLGPLVGAPFSTWDRDNDGDSTENCAARAGSGWWYNSGCDNPCNLLGLGYGHWNNTPEHQLIFLDGIDMEQMGPRLFYTRMFIKNLL